MPRHNRPRRSPGRYAATPDLPKAPRSPNITDQKCTVCRQPLHRFLVEDGETMHVNCDPNPQFGGPR